VYVHLRCIANSLKKRSKISTLPPLEKFCGRPWPRLSLHDVAHHLTWVVLYSGCVSCSSSAHHAPGKKATVPLRPVAQLYGLCLLPQCEVLRRCRSGFPMAAAPIYQVLVRPGRESNSRPTSSEADVCSTGSQAGTVISSGVTRGLSQWG